MNEYVFRERDGTLELVFDFDALYRAEPDPWGQRASDSGSLSTYYQISRTRALGLVRRLSMGAPLKRGLEVGCGIGFQLALLAKHTDVAWEGLDISAAAVERARDVHPSLTFHVGDIATVDLPPMFDVVMISQCLWYVLDRIDDVVANCARLVNPNGLLIISQAFLKTEQRYGADIADGFAGMVALFHARFRETFRLIDASYFERKRLAHNDGLVAYRKIMDVDGRDTREPQEEIEVGR